RDRLRRELAQIGFTLPGSVTQRHQRCGKTSCACKADPPTLHGPYIQWTRKIAGKTITRTLSPQQYQRYQPWFDNMRRLRELTRELEALSLRTVEHAEGWQPKD
ncbi:MAG: DUF6788 family protein, partial [Egibacteraceae bacterium]